MLEERVAQLEEQLLGGEGDGQQQQQLRLRVAELEEQLLGGEGDGQQQQQQQLRLQAEDHLLERSKLRSTECIWSVCIVVFPQVTVLSSANQCR